MPELYKNTLSLRKQTFSGLLWTIVDTFIIRGFSLIATIIFAHILSPKDFGLIGMISIFIAIGTSLVDSGLSSSLIRTLKTDDSDYSTVFYLNLSVSILVYVILFFSAPYIAAFYHQEILINIIRVYCLSFIISSFSSIQLTLLEKEMQFRRVMQYNVPGTIIGVIVGITLAYLGYGVWSIIGMYLVTQIMQSIILWSFSKWKPSRNFSREKMKFHYGFGYKLMLSGLLDTIFKNIYNVVIGKFYPIQSLGYYDRANTLNEYPVTTLSGIIGKVSFPLLSKIQDEKERVAALYKQLLQLTFFLTAPLMLGLAAIAQPLIILVLGEQWLPAVPFFKIICLASMLYPVHAFNINVLKVYGRSDLFLKLEIYKKIIIALSIVIAFRFGILGLIWSAVSSSFIALLINTHYSSEMINYTTKQQLTDMLPVVLVSLAVYIAMNFIVTKLVLYPLYLQIVASSFTGVLIYLVINYVIKSEPLMFSIKLIKGRKL